MVRRSRAGFLALLGTMSASVMLVAGVAWACGPSGFGVPEAPPVPPSATGQPAGPPTSATPTSPQASPPAPVNIDIGPAESAAGTTRGVDAGRTGSQSPRAQAPAQGQSTAPASAGQADITARVEGSTAGVRQQGRQSVFASSTAPAASKADRGKSKASSPARSSTPAVSERSAAGDLWSGVTSRGGNPSLASAAAMGGQSDGLSGGAVAGIAVLGLGLVGIAGGALATAGRRRRAGAGAATRR